MHLCTLATGTCDFLTGSLPTPAPSAAQSSRVCIEKNSVVTECTKHLLHGDRGQRHCGILAIYAARTLLTLEAKGMGL